jgi:hypothetical protein
LSVCENGGIFPRKKSPGKKKAEFGPWESDKVLIHRRKIFVELKFFPLDKCEKLDILIWYGDDVAK